ncbi:hypothetical protein [Pyrinomonas sp.]|uniref:hypothetical protein n=1 Tax=Pyrinomonas sp. TaxID=2080306 RepID=UPI003328A94F
MERKCGADSTESQPQREDEPQTEKKKSPVVGYVIAGASLAILFGLAFLKGRVD